MKYFMIALAAFICVSATPSWAADEAPKLPPAIQAIVEKAEAEVSKNRKAYDAANSKSLDTAEKALKAELEKMTKAGKLEEAMAAKKMLESVRADVVARVDGQAKDNGGLLGETNDGRNQMLGKWKGKNSDGNEYLFDIASDGTMKVNHEWGNGTWEYDATKRIFTITYGNGRRDSFTYDAAKNIMRLSQKGGMHTDLTR